MANFCQLWLTCGDKAEADNIAKTLLQKRLVVCVKQMPVNSDFLWDDKIDHNDETLLIMDSRDDLFDQIEAEVKKLHSYDTFVLQSVPISRLNRAASDWVNKSLKTE